MNLRITLCDLNKSYRTVSVLSDLNLTLSAPDIYCLMAPSGAGKTTLLRILMGLELPDSGTITAESLPPITLGESDSSALTKLIKLTREQYRISAVFQEDRLIEHMNPLENVALVQPGKWFQRVNTDILRGELIRLLPEESLERPVSTLSGGMRRRCALIRALLAPSDLLLLDEPFTGLDEQTKKEAIRYLLEKRDGRLTLIATHSREDAAALGGRVCLLEK